MGIASFLISAPILYFTAGFLIAWRLYNDADEHFFGAQIWAILAFFLWPVIVPVYISLRVRDHRRLRQMQLEREEEVRTREEVPRFASDIYTMRWLKEVERTGGTLYDGPETRAETGFRHFTDEKAESLLTAGKFDHAWEYLIELYLLAYRDGDSARTDTYKHYIMQIPDGRARFDTWREESEDAPVEAIKPKKVRRSDREMPF